MAVIEIGLGLLLIAGIAAVLTGLGGLVPGPAGWDPLPLLGYGGTALILALGVLLVADGSVRRIIARRPERRRGLRTARLSAVALLGAAALAVGLPLAAEPFNLVRIGGIPAGYYLAAEVALVGLVVLAFAWAARQNRIDREEPER